MSTPNPPNVGDTGWGTTLNAFLETTVLADAEAAQASIAAHISAAPASSPLSDPHGDRSFAQQLFAPIQTLINQSGGFVQLSVTGLLPGDIWHDLRPLSGSFVSPTSGRYPPQYRMTLDGTVRLAGYVGLTGSNYNGVTIFPSPIPAAYRPNMPVNLPVTINATGTSTTIPPESALVISPAGNLSFTGLPTGLAAGTFVGIYGTYPLDAPHTLIQT